MDMRKYTLPTPYMVGDIHVYAMELQGELVLFDTGPNTPEALESLRAQIDLDRLKHVFVTHSHLDHCGLVEYLASNTAAEIYLPRRDVLKFRNHERRAEFIRALFREYGFDDRFLQVLGEVVGHYELLGAVPEHFQIVEESLVPGRLGISWMSCPGHSQSDLVYLVDDFAITGDVVLAETFQAPLLDFDLDALEGRFGNYDAYCRTLLNLGRLRGRRILPAHGRASVNLEETVLFYVSKLLERSERVRESADVPEVREVVRTLFGDSLSNPLVAYIKISEIVFLRDFLAAPERLWHSLEKSGFLCGGREGILAAGS